MYGRIEARMRLPESQSMWPAFWLLGNNIKTLNWPACGELDVMEHIDGSSPPYQGAAAPAMTGSPVRYMAAQPAQRLTAAKTVILPASPRRLAHLWNDLEQAAGRVLRG